MASRGLIAQLSQGSARSHHSASNSPSPRRQDNDNNTNTMSSFQPEHESTQQYDTATSDPLPNLRSSARRFGQYQAPRPEPHIDTSFARDGFPDFTEHSPSPDNSQSIELGRGVKRSARNSPNRFGFDGEVSENPLLSLGNDSLYELTGTPPMRSTDRPSLRKQASVRRATSIPQADVTKTSDIVPAKARSTSASNRRTLSDMHARVHAESDSSLVIDERPEAKERNTRFARSRQTSEAIPSRFTAGAGLGSIQTPKRKQALEVSILTGNQTQQSFMLPDLPNITELVSGVRKDGTPVFSRTTKSRSRFTSATYGKGAGDDTTNYARVHSIPLPDDEKAIFTSLQLLKDKVAQLETEKSEAIKRLEEYENEVIDLRSQIHVAQRSRRPDSGLGSEEEGGNEKWRTERSSKSSLPFPRRDVLTGFGRLTSFPPSRSRPS